ncbi:probable protein phosphatase 2C 2 [Daucus carota subsp. sativus]|uniref:probable protein phosphatase 2C 2 n=1 Tax=Daucus carota subsp. sativus TaxID=79200 RepID=UPI0007B222F8|nr:PREDICTED: probable protein phosphatase 2C 2 [Daucus carota subsp. sativus]
MIVDKKNKEMVPEAAATTTADVSVQYTTSVSIEFSQSVFGCSTSIQATSLISTASKYAPKIRSGSHTDIGPRSSNEDEHISIDDLSALLGTDCRWPQPSSFYAVFDGHGGSDASSYVKNNAIKLFLEDADLPELSDNDDKFLEDMKISHQKAFLLADQALANECSVRDSCGTTALTAVVLGRHLQVANAGDSRAVLCRKGVAVPISQDHRPSYLPEQKRIEDLGGYIEYGYLNGELSVTRALGDWYMKLPSGDLSPLTAEPDVQHVLLTEDDEFLIMGCDGIWDVMSNQEAVSLVRRQLRQNDDPQKCAVALVDQALRLDAFDNLTAIVVCFSAPTDLRDTVCSERPKLRCCSLSEESLSKLRSLLQGN